MLKKKLEPRVSYPSKILSKDISKIKTDSDPKLGKFIPSRPALKEMKNVLQAERQRIPGGSSMVQEKMRNNREDNMWVNIDEYLLYKQEDYCFMGC